MKYHGVTAVALVIALAAAAAPRAASAQDGAPGVGRSSEAGRGWMPLVYAYVLSRAGEEVLDPFGMTGRREVLQLLVEGGPVRGRFLRARLDRMGHPDGRMEGWFEIQGDTITLHYGDSDGATGQVEQGRYREGFICFSDREDGRVLTFQYLRPDYDGAPVPPPSPTPAAEERGACAPGAERTS